jgi:methyl-accepting chemotaxis protein
VLSGPVAQLADAQQLKTAFVEMVRSQKNLILATNPEKMRGYEADILKFRKQFEAQLAESTAAAPLADKAKWAELQGAWDQYSPIEAEVRKLAMDNKTEEATKISQASSSSQVTAAVRKSTAELVDIQQEHLKAAEVFRRRRVPDHPQRADRRRDHRADPGRRRRLVDLHDHQPRSAQGC